MKPTITTIFAVIFLVWTMGIASAQTPPATVDGYLGAAKAAAGTDWAGTFLRLCIPPPAAQQGAGGRGRGGAPRVPARETWYAEPAKVADNLYFLGTKIHSAWAVVGTEGIVIIEALFDYAAKDEILDGMKKLVERRSRSMGARRITTPTSPHRRKWRRQPRTMVRRC